MRPIRLKMTAFGPYAEETVIDMDRLGKQGLYLITGDTGAGKTTIFDGITYALYGATSGGIRDGAMMRSTFAGEDQPTEVELTFLYDGEEYRILRRPPYERRKKRGEGRITTQSYCEFQLPREAGSMGGEVQTLTKEKEVTAKITEMLGVDREQFTRIAMLAQGDFRKLILAETKERIEIFRHLFRTERYRKLQEAFRAEAKAMEEERRETERKIEMYTSGLEADAQDGELREALAKARDGALTPAEMEALSEKLLTGDRKQLEDLGEKVDRTEKILAGLQKKLSRIEDAEKLRDEQARSEEEKKRIGEALEEAEKRLIKAEEGTEIIEALKREAAVIEAEIEKGEEEEKLQLLKQEKEKKRKEEEYQEAAEEYKILSAKSDEDQKKFRVLQKMMLDAQAGILAQSLEDGVPCPVCGATEHPSPAKLSEDIPTEKEVKAAEKDAERSQREAEEASRNAAVLKRDVIASREDVEKRVAELEAAIEKTREQKEVLEDRRKRIKNHQEEIEEARARVEKLKVRIEGIKGRIQATEKALEASSSEDGNPIREELKRTTSEKRRLQIAREEITARLNNNEKNLQGYRRAFEAWKAREKTYNNVYGLAETVSGTQSGADKIMLETYVQMQFFDRIIERANTRLLVMTGGRYRMIRRKTATSRQGQSGLDLDVIDYHNGSQRDIKTLSGGESFEASLSLALGLSDEIQSSAGGIHLDTMFVDEGFGSLDPETLNQAMAALSTLSENNRLVGIISHVEEMKNRIDKQIRVTKNSDGTSSAVVTLM